MDEKEELEQELLWVQYRQKMLDMIEVKLLEMRGIAEQSKRKDITAMELDVLNDRLNNLTAQVRAIDGESRKMEDGEILQWALVVEGMTIGAVLLWLCVIFIGY